MIIESITENEDGSATIIIDVTKDEKRMLIGSAVINAIEKQIEYQKKHYESND